MSEIEKARLALAHDLAEADAAGDCPYCDGSGKAEDVGPRNAVEAGAMDEHDKIAIIVWQFCQTTDAPLIGMTVLARRLAEALETAQGWMIAPTGRPIPKTDERQVYAALTEARKAGLIE